LETLLPVQVLANRSWQAVKLGDLGRGKGAVQNQQFVNFAHESLAEANSEGVDIPGQLVPVAGSIR
jgi:hypothetical protein